MSHDRTLLVNSGPCNNSVYSGANRGGHARFMIYFGILTYWQINIIFNRVVHVTVCQAYDWITYHLLILFFSYYWVIAAWGNLVLTRFSQKFDGGIVVCGVRVLLLAFLA